MNTIENYKIISLSYRNTPLSILGNFVFGEEKEALREKLEFIKAQFELQELMYLATCNRIMFIFVQNAPLTPQSAGDFLSKIYKNVSEEELKTACDTVQIYEGEVAAQYLFEVASSIDSLVIGEREILRQLRNAYDSQSEMGLTGDCLRLLMRFTVEAAKKVYSNTAIGEKPISVVSLAMQKLFSLPLSKETRFIIVGAGQTNQLVAKFLSKKDFKHFAVFNRSLPKAQQLAQALGGEAHLLADLAAYKGGFDVLIACTGATEAVINPELYQKLIGNETSSKILLDLSVPYNIDQAIVTDNNCTYIEIEQLKSLAQENMSFRENEVSKAKALLGEELVAFLQLFQARQIERALRAVPEQIRAVKDHALNNVFKNDIAQLDEASKQIFDKVLAYMEKRCVAIPIQVAKENLVRR